MLTEGMDLSDIERLGWPASPIVEARWSHDGKPISIKMTPGSLAKVVAGRHYVAILINQVDKTPSRLLILDQDGMICREVSNRQSINGKLERVDFGWFEKPRVTDGQIVSVVVSLPRGVTYQLDVDAVSGNVIRTKESR